MNARARLAVVLGVLRAVAAGSAAYAQPIDPYKQPPPAGPVDPYAGPDKAPPAPPPRLQPVDDPQLAEQVALVLVARAQELLDARVWVDAKQLAVEALIKSGNGAAGAHARAIIRAANRALGIPDGRSGPLPPPKPVAPAPTPTPEVVPDSGTIDDPTTRVAPAPTTTTTPAPDTTVTAQAGEPMPAHGPRTAAIVHGGLEGGLVGAMIGSLFVNGDGKAATATAVGVVGAAGGAYGAEKLFEHWGASEAQVRTVGAGGVWGGVLGGLIADISGENTTARQVLLGATIGSAVGIGGAALLAHASSLTRGDVALVDTFAGIGVAGGFTVGLIMQPAQSEAYSLNAVLGGAAGIVVGLIAAPGTNTTPRRMERVAAAAAVGGAVPMIILAGSRSSGAEQVTGLLSTVGLVVGAYLGFHWTSHMDEGLDIKDGALRKVPPPVDAPAAMIGRSSNGQWALGGIGVQPLSTQLASPEQQRGMSFSLVSGAW